MFLKFLGFSTSIRARYAMTVAALLLLGAACGPGKVKPLPEWNFEPDAIHIRYDAGADLNEYNESSHTLMLIVFQLTDAADFMGYTRTTDGIKRLLQFSNNDPAKTVSLKNTVDTQTFIITPGSEKTLKLDRVESAKWVGLVAGYFDIDPERCSRVFPIPVEKTETGFFRREESIRPGVLEIETIFGRHAIHDIRKKQ